MIMLQKGTKIIFLVKIDNQWNREGAVINWREIDSIISSAGTCLLGSTHSFLQQVD